MTCPLRTRLGFIIAPLIPGLVMGGVIAVSSVRSHDIIATFSLILLASTITSAACGYPVAFAGGIPLYLWFQRHNVRGLVHFVFAGTILGVAEIFFFTLFLFRLPPWELVLCWALSGAGAAGIFWLIARPDQIWTTPSPAELSRVFS